MNLDVKERLPRYFIKRVNEAFLDLKFGILAELTFEIYHPNHKFFKFGAHGGQDNLVARSCEGIDNHQSRVLELRQFDEVQDLLIKRVEQTQVILER